MKTEGRGEPCFWRNIVYKDKEYAKINIPTAHHEEIKRSLDLDFEICFFFVQKIRFFQQGIKEWLLLQAFVIANNAFLEKLIWHLLLSEEFFSRLQRRHYFPNNLIYSHFLRQFSF